MTIEAFTLPPRAAPRQLYWPADGQPGGAILEFHDPEQWRTFVQFLGLHPVIPTIVAAKFDRAQTLYLLGWIDPGLIKAGELAALVALELAVTDRYGGAFRKRPAFSALLKHMVTVDGLADADMPLVARSGGTAIGQLTGETRPTLAERRNSLAHGDPFEGWPTSGLLELVRDLINFAYRHYISEGLALGLTT